MHVLISKIAESYNPAYKQHRQGKISGDSINLRLKKRLLTPVLAPLLRNKSLISIFMGVAVTQLLLVYAGLRGWQCPIYETLGVTCPGCGMTSAIAELLKGHWHMAIQTHAFAPVILIVFKMMLIALILPASYLINFSGSVEWLEQKLGLTAILLLSMVGYWLLRIFDFI